MYDDTWMDGMDDNFSYTGEEKILHLSNITSVIPIPLTQIANQSKSPTGGWSDS